MYHMFKGYTDNKKKLSGKQKINNHTNNISNKIYMYKNMNNLNKQTSLIIIKSNNYINKNMYNILN